MIQTGFTFPLSSKRRLLASLLSLPGPLHPIQMKVGEDERGTPVCNDLANIDRLNRGPSGFFLVNRNCTYDIDCYEKLQKINLSCFLDLPSSHAKTFMLHVAKSSPQFGYACLPDEREAKNRVHNKIGINSIESWVGRDVDRSLPGLYWWTIISSPLAEKHSIPIAALSSVALEHAEMSDALHLFRFYERPEDWREATAVRKLTVALPGIFDIEKAREAMAAAKTLLEHSAISRQWK